MGLWPFFLKRTIQTKGIIKVDHEKALAALQDAPTMITLNPLVVHHETKPDDPSTYHITDNIQVLSWTMKTVYTDRAEPLDDGIAFHVKAGGGMSSVNFWRSRPREEEPGTVEVLEEANIEVRFYCIKVGCYPLK